MLRSVLVGVEQPLGVPVTGMGRAGDRVQARVAGFALHERFRRGADEGELAELEQEEVRRRVDAPQGAVELERRGGGPALGALGEHDLERVAGPDVLPDPLDALFVRGLVGRAPHG